MTLMELLLVMGLMAMLLGAGIGVLSRMDLGRRAAIGTVQNAIRAARNSALARNAPAHVSIDVKNSTLTSESLAVIGTWHFESERLEGAFEIDGVLRGAAIVDDGFIGHALSFAGKPGAAAEFPVQNDASYDLSRGFAVECAMRVDADGGGKLLRIGESVGIELGGARSLKAWFAPEILGTNGSVIRGGKISAETLAGAVPEHRWVRVRVEYDRRRLLLALDDIEVARIEANAPVWRVEEPLMLSDSQGTAFPGSIDNLVISAVAASDELLLPQTVHFGADSATQIYFDAGGDLDRALHDTPVVVTLQYEDNTTAQVRVGMYGTVE